MRYIIFLTIITFSPLFIHADYLYVQKNRCITDYWINQSDQRFYYIYSHDPDKIRSTSSTRHEIIDGYDYNTSNDICAPKQILKNLQISNYQYHFLLALIGLLSGFVFLFFSIYIVIDVAKK